ncbi:MAG: histidine--tRNA ligase [Bacteroidia bacterium]|nr:MAG: histidine--tRNA ligase [Bacteroidia bacterium]
MAKEKPGIPKGTRDFDPLEISRREHIFNTIREVYRLHGFRPIETPAMENLSTLMGKYGEEGDRLIFKILNSGDFPSKVEDKDWQSRNASLISSRICEKALRYDLTVPFARYVVQHQHKITFPFKRYQMQAVWRADKPQKGRYREFFQCDADVIGSDSLANEAEFMQIIDKVFSQLNIDVIIKINNRKILAGLAEHIGFPDRFTEITTAIDKTDKIGLENVTRELIDRGLTKEAVDQLIPVLELTGTSKEKIQMLQDLLSSSEVGMQGLSEIQEVFDIVDVTPLHCRLELDLCLARGLNYYTGAIIEVKSVDVNIGSLCGGGRYDDLTGIFGLPGVSGVGVSFGADRIYDVLQALSRFPDSTGAFSQILAINFGTRERNYCLPALENLRSIGVQCEMYPEPAKIKKQMQYADKNNIPFVLMAGEEEMKKKLFSLKDMRTGDQQQLMLEQISDVLMKYFDS